MISNCVDDNKGKDDDDVGISQDDDNGGCNGNDDSNCKDKNNDDNYFKRYATPSPTIFEDNVSNDHSCWWCVRGQRDSTSNGSFSDYNGNNGGSSFSISYGTVAITGTVVAAIASIILKKVRYLLNLILQ